MRESCCLWSAQGWVGVRTRSLVKYVCFYPHTAVQFAHLFLLSFNLSPPLSAFSFLSLFLRIQDCPFIVCMTYAFHTPDKLCFILDLMNGESCYFLVLSHARHYPAPQISLSRMLSPSRITLIEMLITGIQRNITQAILIPYTMHSLLQSASLNA